MEMVAENVLSPSARGPGVFEINPTYTVTFSGNKQTTEVSVTAVVTTRNSAHIAML
jgi:hypothetical protein